MFLKEQPDVNWQNPEVRQAQLDVFRFWLERGVDGFRLDVFNAYFKHPGLEDNPTKFGLSRFDKQIHVNDMDRPEMMPLLGELRSLLDSYPERYSVGEPFVPTIEKTAHYAGEGKLHTAFHFFYDDMSLIPKWGANHFRRQMLELGKASSSVYLPALAMSNHDSTRAASRYCRGEDDANAKLAMAMLLTMRGTPFIYYGEEIGMRNISLSRKEIMDPVGKYYWPIIKGRDGCRAPMQWNDSRQRRLLDRQAVAQASPKLHGAQRRCAGKRRQLNAQLHSQADCPAQGISRAAGWGHPFPRTSAKGRAGLPAALHRGDDPCRAEFQRQGKEA